MIAAAKFKGQAKAKAKAKSKPLDTTTKRADVKNSDYWVVNEDSFLLIRHHVKPRQTFMGLRYVRGNLPVAENRLTGWRQTERHFTDGTSDIEADEDFRLRDDDKVVPTEQPTQSWRGRTIFRLKPLTGKALEKAKIAAQKFQQAPAKTRQKDRFRLASDDPSSDLPPALTDNPPSSSRDPPAQPIVSDPGVSSRGTEKRIDRQHIVTTKEGEKLIMNKLRSLRDFDLDMKDLIVRLFYTKDPQTDQTRTTDHWVQTPGYWIRMVHTERDDLIDPDNCPSPLSSADAIAFGDTLNAERYTCILECSDPQQNGLEIDDFWCNYTDQAGNPKSPEEDPGRKLPYRWIGFSVFQVSSPMDIERPVPETVEVATNVTKAPRGLKASLTSLVGICEARLFLRSERTLA